MSAPNNAAKTKNPSINFVKNTIESDILSGKYHPNQRLIEEEIAKNLGVSRTPVRESLKQLEAKGLVTRLPSRGLVVSSITVEDVKHTFQVRESLECLAIEMACENATKRKLDKAQSYLIKYRKSMEKISLNPERDKRAGKEPDWNSLFHHELHAASGNLKLVYYLEDIRDVHKLAYISRYFRLEDLVLFEEQHYKILNAVREKDKAKATLAVKEHLKTIREFYLRYL